MAALTVPAWSASMCCRDSSESSQVGRPIGLVMMCGTDVRGGVHGVLDVGQPMRRGDPLPREARDEEEYCETFAP